MVKIKITNLRLRAIIGINAWERKIKQPVVVNISFHYDASKAIAGDDFKMAIDYKALTKDIIEEVETSKYFLLEKLAHRILAIVTADSAVYEAVVQVDKPKALRFTDSVAIELRQ